MQTVVFDGVRRNSASGSRPQALVLGTPRKRPEPLAQNTLGRIGMDGVRRVVPTPRELLEQVTVAEPVAPATLIPAVAIPQRQMSRPMIAFSVIASALIVAGVTGSRLIPARAATDTAVRPVASGNVATPSALPSATPSPTPAAPAAASPTYSSVQNVLDSFVAAHGSQYTIYVKDLKSGQVATSNSDRVMMSASLYKLFVAQRIYQMIDTGDLSYSQIAGPESGGNTIEGCLKLMITISDNACGHDLGKIVGWGKYDPQLKAAGFSGTSLGNVGTQPQTNAKDVALLFERLYSGTSMSPNATERFLTLLKSQRVNDRLPKGLPTGTTFAHKTGDLAGYTHDAGIVYGKNTDFLVVVMSGPWATPESSKPAFGNLAGQLNSLFNN